MRKANTLIIAITLAAASPLAQASLSGDAHAFKENVKTAGKKGGHAVRDATFAIGRGTKAAAHGVADATKHGYHATKRAVTGHD